MKVLIIENDHVLNNSTELSLKRAIRSRHNESSEPTVILNAYNNIVEIKEAIASHDIIAFQTSFIQQSAEIAPAITKILANTEEKKHLVIMCDNFKKYFLDGIEYYANQQPSGQYDPMLIDEPINKLDMLLASIAHHDIYEICEDTTIDFTLEASRFREWEKRRLDYLVSLKDAIIPNKKVMINDLSSAPVFASEALSTGDVVDTYNCEKIDASPARGVWVMIGDKPLKLLKDRGYNEFEFVEEGEQDIIEKIIISTDIQYQGQLSQNNYFLLKGIIEDDELSENDKANQICESFDIEKRGNRAIIRTLLNKNNLVLN